MAKSKAKRMRAKLEREGRRNPELSRGTWDGFNPVERKPLHPKAEQERKENKHKGQKLGGRYDYSTF